MTLEKYKSVNYTLPKKNITWPLYGSGLDSLGKNGKPVEQKMPEFKPDELLIRHDAVGLCFTDVKEISFGNQHPRLMGRDLKNNPIVPGHEVSITVVGVGEKLKSSYNIGDRFVIQPDVWYQGKSIPYSFGMDGAYRQYGVIGKEVLDGDAGCYLIPIADDMSYAAAALTEPWACVEAAYTVTARTTFQKGGIVWFFGNENARHGFSLTKILNKDQLPKKIYVSSIPLDLYQNLQALSKQYNIELITDEMSEIIKKEIDFSDIIGLDVDADDVNMASEKLAKGGIFSILRKDPMTKPIEVDLGRIHYDNIFYTGTTGLDIDEAYQATPIRSSLVPKGKTLIVGSGGPMGRMHLQRAMESSLGPSLIVGTDVEKERISNLRAYTKSMLDSSKAAIEIVDPVNEPVEYASLMSKITSEGGFDDIEIMVTNIEVIVRTMDLCANKGVINLFAGLKRGTKASIDAYYVYGPKQLRLIGHSGSKLSDQITIVDNYNRGDIQPHRSMAAVCGMNQIAEGVQAMIDAAFPGKIVVYPMIENFPLTGLPELINTHPEIYNKLEHGFLWTNDAENTFLETTLSDL